MKNEIKYKCTRCGSTDTEEWWAAPIGSEVDYVLPRIHCKGCGRVTFKERFIIVGEEANNV